MWCLVCIRNCVGGYWTVDGRCRAEAGDALEVEGLIEMQSCICDWSYWWRIMQLRTVVASWQGLSGQLCGNTGLKDGPGKQDVCLATQRHMPDVEWKGLQHWLCGVGLRPGDSEKQPYACCGCLRVGGWIGWVAFAG